MRRWMIALLVSLSVCLLPTSSLAANPNDGSLPSYGAGLSGLVFASSANDVFTVSAASGKTIHLKTLTVSGTASAIAAIEIALLRRSTGDTGGTSTLPAPVAMDSTDAPSSAVIRAYTANPTAFGTQTGVIAAAALVLTPTATTTISSNPVVFDFTSLGKRAPSCTGTENLVLSVNSNTISGNRLSVYATWTEE